MSLVPRKALIPAAPGPLLQEPLVFLEGRGPQSPTTKLDTYQEGPCSPHTKKILSLKKLHTCLSVLSVLAVSSGRATPSPSLAPHPPQPSQAGATRHGVGGGGGAHASWVLGVHLPETAHRSWLQGKPLRAGCREGWGFSSGKGEAWRGRVSLQRSRVGEEEWNQGPRSIASKDFSASQPPRAQGLGVHGVPLGLSTWPAVRLLQERMLGSPGLAAPLGRHFHS